MLSLAGSAVFAVFSVVVSSSVLLPMAAVALRVLLLRGFFVSSVVVSVVARVSVLVSVSLAVSATLRVRLRRFFSPSSAGSLVSLSAEVDVTSAVAFSALVVFLFLVCEPTMACSSIIRYAMSCNV